MEEWEREDLIKGVSYCIEVNYCAIKQEDLFKKFKNTDRDTLRSAIDTMKRRGMLRYDVDADKYRLVIK